MSLRNAANGLSLLVKTLPHCGQAHKSTQFQAWQRCDPGGEGAHILRGDARFALLRVDIDLYADIEVAGMSRSLGRQPLCDFQAVNRVNPLKMLGCDLRLVRLKVADEVPDQVVPSRFFDLFEPFLHEIFAEVPLPGFSCLENGLDGLFLADGEKPDPVRRPSGISRSFRQQILDFSKVFRDSNHVLLRVLRYTRQPMGPGYGKSDQQFFEGKVWPSTLLSYCRSR